ncbi:glycosyltransferase [Streptomyces sp. BK205]|uniref:glycosyltransferase family 2 protein n=1 Tax=Streptomyces sp. BK205 TaxID=2512164 RepID=UPI0010514ECA|nr:glycosyltransferase [Streptomyces sp. BK205]TCR16030.1 glycosyl transferase family 2 [Streptomyces sp. BK205]
MPPLLSVVVPMFDVEPYISSCIESLLGQRLLNIEIIVIDDGSTDGSRVLADQWARKDSRVRVTGQPNAGLSAARNAGVRAARGKYLSFCDSDDVVPVTGYASLVGSLEDTGSDIATGDVRRLDTTGVRPHPGYRDVFARDRRRTHIRHHTALVRDRMVWNKVFRRSFWDACGLAFALPAYEDAPVMIRAHIEAAAVDVLSEVVYFWRIREQGPPSITQRRHEPANIAACMRMVLDTFDVITTLAPELVPPYVDDMCRGDIRQALRMLHLHDDDALSDALTLARSFIGSIPDDVLRALPTTDRQLAALLVQGDLAQIRRLVEKPIQAMERVWDGRGGVGN